MFVSQGFDVDFVSPKGNKVEFMMASIEIISYTIKYEDYLDKANHSLVAIALAAIEVIASDYWGYIGGGYGTLFDVANNPDLQDIIAAMYKSG